MPDEPGYKPRGRQSAPDPLVKIGMATQASNGLAAPNHHYERRELGWEPTCRCDAGEPIPQTVLDPFAGSGTTLYVARHHGRRAMGIELNGEYARLAADRLKQGVLPLEVS